MLMFGFGLSLVEVYYPHAMAKSSLSQPYKAQLQKLVGTGKTLNITLILILPEFQLKATLYQPYDILGVACRERDSIAFTEKALC